MLILFRVQRWRSRERQHLSHQINPRRKFTRLLASQNRLTLGGPCWHEEMAGFGAFQDAKPRASCYVLMFRRSIIKTGHTDKLCSHKEIRAVILHGRRKGRCRLSTLLFHTWTRTRWFWWMMFLKFKEPVCLIFLILIYSILFHDMCCHDVLNCFDWGLPGFVLGPSPWLRTWRPSGWVPFTL